MPRLRAVGVHLPIICTALRDVRQPESNTLGGTADGCCPEESAHMRRHLTDVLGCNPIHVAAELTNIKILATIVMAGVQTVLMTKSLFCLLFPLPHALPPLILP